MKQIPFVYWKEPGRKEIFTLTDPVFKKISNPEISSEGFLFYPYKNNDSGYFIKGSIKQTTKTDLSLIAAGTIKETNTNKNSHYTALVEKAVNEIKSGVFEKVVLARTSVHDLPQNFDLNLFYNKLVDAYPDSFVYCISLTDEIWLGASPEIFLKKENDYFLTFAMAGTRGPDSLQPFGAKEKEEQQIVKNYILQILNDNGCESIESSNVIELNTGNLKHLMTEIKFKSENPLQIVKKLHPTPAICGMPLNSSSAFIDDNEKLNRKFYSGFLGPVYSNSDFSLFVNLRCAQIKSMEVTFYAGAGILAGSNAEAEWIETEKKIDTLRFYL